LLFSLFGRGRVGGLATVELASDMALSMFGVRTPSP